MQIFNSLAYILIGPSVAYAVNDLSRLWNHRKVKYMLIHIIYIMLISVAYIIGFMVGITRANKHDNIAKEIEREENQQPNADNGRRIIEQARNRKEAYLKQTNKL